MHPNVLFNQTGFRGLIEIVPSAYADERGFFLETYRSSWKSEFNPVNDFVQENQSFSVKGTVRGLHFQKAPYAQAKLVRVISGSVLDVVVDMRRGEPTFGKFFSIILDSKKHNQLYIPEGFAHGLAALEDSIFFYKCSAVYNKAAESGIVWNDPDLAIQWNVNKPIVSEKDMVLPTFQDLIRNSVI